MKESLKEALYRINPIGLIHSSVDSKEKSPKQGYEGAPEAWLEIEARFTEGLLGLEPGMEIWVLTWLHQGCRDELQTHPRGDETQPLAGVFATRSPNRPNPIGIHKVTILEIKSFNHFKVFPLEAFDGTPIIDIKPVLSKD